METVFHGVDACRNGPVREKRPSAADIDCLPAEFTDAVVFHGSPHGIGHNDNLVRPLDFYQQAQDRIVDVQPIRDDLRCHRKRQGRADHAGFTVMKGTHGVEGMGDVAGPCLDGPAGFFIGCTGMTKGNDDALLQHEWINAMEDSVSGAMTRTLMTSQ